MQKMSSTPYGRAAAVFLAPFLCTAMAIGAGMIEFEQVTKFANCVAECDCARSYAIGGVVVWLIAMQGAMKSVKPEKLEVNAPPLPELTPEGKVAAKAA